MKSFLLTIVLVTLACGVAYGQTTLNISEEQRTRARQYATECTAQEGVTNEQVQALQSGQVEGADNKLKCFANCFLERVGYLKDGVIQEARVTQSLGTAIGVEKLKTIISKCNGLKGTDNCDTGFQVLNCYRTERASIL